MKKTALVLSGGGALGVAHVGALQVLEAHYEFDYICGVSAGAIIGAGAALGLDSQEMWDFIEETNLFSAAFDFSLKNTGLVQGDKIHQILDQIYEGKTFEDVKTPLIIGTTDFETGQQVLVNKGKIADAVRSSLSIPLVFQPFFHPIYKKHLADGFLSQNFPLDTVCEQYSGEHIIGIDVATIPALKEDFGTEKFLGRGQDLFSVLQRTFRIMYQNQQTQFPHDPRVLLIKPELDEFSSITLGHSNFVKMKEIGQESAANAIRNP